MDLEAFHKGVYSLVVSVSLTVSQVLMPSLPPPAAPALQDPGSAQSFDVVSENYNLELPSSFQEATSKAIQEPSDEVTVTLPDKVTEATSEALVTVELPPKSKKVVSGSTSSPLSPQPSAVSKKQQKEKKAISSPPSAVSKKQVEEKKTETITPQVVVGALTGAAEKLFQLANEHRAKVGLPAFEKEERICKIAEARAPQVYDEVFKDGPMHKGFKALALPYWATENIAAYDSIEKNFSFWLRDGIHRQALEGPSKYSCVACAGSYCSQIFTSFIPK